MSDIELKQDPITLEFDIEFANGDIVTTDDLETSIIISLFTDKRANDDELPDKGTDKRGYWGDEFELNTGDQLGSLLWTLERRVIDETFLSKAKKYAKDALQWMIDDGVAESVDVIVERYSSDTVAIKVDIKKPGDVQLTEFQLKWKAQEIKR